MASSAHEARAKSPTGRRPAAAGQSAYERDPHAWYLRQAALLRARRVADADLENIAEELEDMGRSEAKALRASLRLICLHLLKWQHQPRRRSKSWSNTIARERINAARALSDSPSLRAKLAQLAAEAYEDARREAILETGLPAAAFPASCPYSIEQITAEGFLPGAADSRS
jgi:hypothetical protein